MSPYSDLVSLRFRSIVILNLRRRTNSLAHSSIGTPSPGLAAQLRLLVSTWFQELFHRPPGLLFTFPSRYWFTIGGQKYLALPDSPGWFLLAFTRRAVLGIWNETQLQIVFSYEAFTLFDWPSQTIRLTIRRYARQKSADVPFRPATPKKPLARSLSATRHKLRLLQTHFAWLLIFWVLAVPFSLAATKGIY